MSPREEEEFELVLGNKQLLSLFFLVVVLFGVFFSFGYTVGYSRGETSRTRDVAGAEPLADAAKKVELPEALLQDAPKPSTPTAAAKTEPEPSAPKNTPAPSPTAKSDPPPVVAKSAPASQAPKPRPVQEPPKPVTPPASKTAPSTAASAPPKSSAAPKSSGAAPTGQSVANATHLQVSAVRVQRDAEVYVEQLRAKGHPAAVSDQGDGWYRVVVGPFATAAEAESYQKRLSADGVDSLLRKR